jgi:hypothetical protein
MSDYPVSGFQLFTAHNSRLIIETKQKRLWFDVARLLITGKLVPFILGHNKNYV